FLNDYRNYETLNVKKIVSDLIEIISASPYSNHYQKKCTDLQDSNVYKIFVMGVGIHDKNEILLSLYDSNNNIIKNKEIAHIDSVVEEGSWMNRLYLCYKKPKSAKFYNMHDNIKYKTINSLVFDEQCTKFECNF
ncbi:MAG: hypothetical protein J5896_02315, partial [Alphaproteobacteria bacterium]|nr:hypothetical protein [Alphaproteobacteria bacterium]